MDLGNKKGFLKVLLRNVATLFYLGIIPGFFACTPSTGIDNNKKPPNILLITIDTLRADHLPLYGYKGVETPNISALSADGALFENAVSHAPLTLPSHTSILTGAYPISHGVRNNGSFYAPDALETMAEILKSAGYDTAAFVGSFVLDSRFGLNQGYDLYDDDMIDGRQRKSIFEFKDRIAENVINRAMAWLDGRKDKPFHLWVHLYDPHAEYDPPEPFKTMYAQNPYDGEIAYTDKQVGRLISKLKNKDLYKDTLIVLTSDHGESLGEHSERTHSIFIYNATTWVPLVIKLPGRRYAGKKIGNMVRSIDILPTVMDIAGLTEKTAPDRQSMIQGESLLPLVDGSVKELRLTAYAESYFVKDYFNWSMPEFIRTDKFKYINLPEKEFYDLEKDPDELNNIYAENMELAEKYAKKLDEIKKASSRSKLADTRRKMDRETLLILKSLGYLHGDDEGAEQDENENDKQKPDPKEMILVHEEFKVLQNLLNEKKHEDALEKAKDLIAMDPENVRIRSALAQAYLRNNETGKAIVEYERIKNADPRQSFSYMALANIYIKSKIDLAAAERELKAAFAVAPQNPALWVVQGNLDTAKGNIEDAVKSYGKAQDMGVQSPALYLGLGSAYNMQNKLEKATALFEKAIYIDNDFSEAHYNLAVVREKTGRPDLAERGYRLAIEYDSNNHYALTNLGSLLTNQGKYLLALEAFKEAVKIKPDHVEAVYNLGTIYLNLEKPKEAIPYLKKAIELQPDLLYAYNNLAQAYGKLGDRENAFRVYRAIARAFPQAPMAFYNMALIAASQGKMEEAQGHLKKALELGGERIRKNAKSEKAFEKLDF